ncbi:hypothetical protein E2C01_053489 [Portunus trituberculatus]|uniref:Uncharacterized protein n=1 Tax=Portunus trituberculatus TaxID=210409 RepID=A0A5B7GGW9_PORTR|nr:hypothetical protein [Portunus trituberculatus]
MDAILQQEVALTLLKNLGSSSRSTRDRGGEAPNHSEAAAFGPSPGKFKPRKFVKTDVLPIASSGELSLPRSRPPYIGMVVTQDVPPNPNPGH